MNFDKFCGKSKMAFECSETQILNTLLSILSSFRKIILMYYGGQREILIINITHSVLNNGLNSIVSRANGYLCNCWQSLVMHIVLQSPDSYKMAFEYNSLLTRYNTAYCVYIRIVLNWHGQQLEVAGHEVMLKWPCAYSHTHIDSALMAIVPLPLQCLRGFSRSTQTCQSKSFKGNT